MNISQSKQERAAGTSARGGSGGVGVSGQPRVGPSNTASSPPDPPLSTSFKILTGATLRFAKCVANRRALSCLPHTKRKNPLPLTSPTLICASSLI